MTIRDPTLRGYASHHGLPVGPIPCFYCGCPARALDHKIPHRRGGETCWDNLVPACPFCNSRKHVRDVEEFRASLQRLASVVYGQPVRFFGEGARDAELAALRDLLHASTATSDLTSSETGRRALWDLMAETHLRKPTVVRWWAGAPVRDATDRTLRAAATKLGLPLPEPKPEPGWFALPKPPTPAQEPAAAPRRRRRATPRDAPPE